MKTVKPCYARTRLTMFLLLGWTGCAASESNVTASTAATTTSATPPEGATLTDAQIAGIASRIDLAEIDAGKLALARGKNVKVQQFAEHMVSAHGAVEAKLGAMLKSQGIATAESSICDKLTADTESQKQALLGLFGADFDRSYLNAQLKDHEDVLALFDSKLLVQVKNPQLKAALEATRTKVVEHIEMAKDALASLTSS